MGLSEKQIWDEVVAQLEYYFGDFNLPKDSFMQKVINKNDGWISIDALLKFNRLKSLVNNDKQLLIDSVNNSKSDLIELSECQTKIRRKLHKPLPELNKEYEQKLKERTVHVKGMPKCMNLKEVLHWCKQYGNVESVRMRRFIHNGQFNGHIFVTFSLKSAADQLISIENHYLKDRVLSKESFVEYEARRALIEEKKQLKREKRYQLRQKLRSEKQKLQSESLLRQAEEQPSGGVKAEENGDRDTNNEQNENPIKAESTVLKLNGLPRSLGFNRVRQYFKQYAKVALVRKADKNSIFVQFAHEFDAKNVLAKIQNDSQTDETCHKVVIDENEAIALLVSGEEEKKFWIEANMNKKSGRNVKLMRDRKRATSGDSALNESKRL